MDFRQLIADNTLLQEMRDGKEILWINPDKTGIDTIKEASSLTIADIEDAEARLTRFAPLIMKLFPETAEQNGIIESVLTEIPFMQARLEEKYRCNIPGKLLLKQDSHLPIAGSVKARGGIYEVLKHTEELALQAGLLTEQDNYEILASEEARAYFSSFTIQVGSTGNLGMSIGIMSAKIGYRAIVHMSVDAKQWKKDLLRSHGVTVIEYASDYSDAVKNGRILSDQDPSSYFVDDENSVNLFLGYAVAAKRLSRQLAEKSIPVDETHPLFVYIPCGVGGAPGGITFGLRQVFGDYVHCFFVEPVNAPCMVLGMSTGLNNQICVQDIGLSGLTHADGLAVGRPSGFVGSFMKPYLSGEFTLQDAKLYEYMRDLLESEDVFLEPSACAAFHCPVTAMNHALFRDYLKNNVTTDVLDHACHIAWATGGKLVPESIREEYKHTYL